MNRQDFINQIVPSAINVYKKYGVLPSLTLAQACLESNFGSAAPRYNLFGIKWSEGCGRDKQLLSTNEVINGKEVKVNDWFRAYNSYDESIDDYGQLLAMPLYKRVTQAKNYRDASLMVQACGYATDPNYATKLIKLIEDYKLNQWDEVKIVDVNEAIQILKDNGVINSPDYWEKATAVVIHLDQLLINMANKLIGAK